MSDAFWIALIGGLPATIASVGAFYLIVVNSRKQDEKQDAIAAKMDAVKQSTDGLMHAAVADAAEKGRVEGAAIATAGAAAVAKEKGAA